jgi:hypothetical protein
VIKIDTPTTLNVIRASLTVSSLLLSAEIFLIGLYLADWRKGVEENRLRPFVYLLGSLLLPSLALIPLNLTIILPISDLDQWTKCFLSFIALLPLIPDAVILFVMFKKKM